MGQASVNVVNQSFQKRRFYGMGTEDGKACKLANITSLGKLRRVLPKLDILIIETTSAVTKGRV